MATGGPVQELCEEASCSICLDYFDDPVMIAECGHNYCRACLARSWGESGEEASCCPLCRSRATPKSLRRNLQLANFVEIIKKLSPLEGQGGVRQKPQRCFCKEEEVPLCEVCRTSKERRDGEEAAPESRAVVAARKGGVCQKHQEPLKLFCKDDEALICVVCDRSKEHRDHKTLPLEEASQEYKDQFRHCLEILKKERERIVAYQGDVVKESQDLLKQTTGKKQETVANFRQLHTFLEEQEKLLLAQMEEVEKEVARKMDQYLSKLSEMLYFLESLIWDMEDKCEQPASELLQDVRSILQRYEEKEMFENPVTYPLAFKWRIWDVCDMSHLLEGIIKQLKDTLDSGVRLQKAKVTLDLDTAHPNLVLNKAGKSMRSGEKPRALPNNPERFDRFCVVLGREGFRAGRHFWEVLVGSEEGWAVGVARKSVRRKGVFYLGPEEGIWAVGKWRGGYKASVKGHYPPMTIRGELKRIRVCLNYSGGRVTFFDADRGALICEFSGASFSGETLLPFFWVHLKGHLQLF